MTKYVIEISRPHYADVYVEADSMSEATKKVREMIKGSEGHMMGFKFKSREDWYISDIQEREMK